MIFNETLVDADYVLVCFKEYREMPVAVTSLKAFVIKNVVGRGIMWFRKYIRVYRERRGKEEERTKINTWCWDCYGRHCRFDSMIVIFNAIQATTFLRE